MSLHVIQFSNIFPSAEYKNESRYAITTEEVSVNIGMLGASIRSIDVGNDRN
jgi:hypothetical protein